MLSRRPNGQNRHICRVGSRVVVARGWARRIGSDQLLLETVCFWSDEHVLGLVVMLPDSVTILTATDCTP